MSNKELISIIIPVYNIEGYLPKCLDTIARQTYSNLEIILVDDGSTDGTGHICDKFAEQDSRAVVFHHEQNRQLWAARNTGQAAAHGEYIMFVDGDDYLHLDALRIMHEAINRDGGYDMAIINYKETVSSDEDITSRWTEETETLSQDDLMNGLFRRWVNVWTKLYRRDVIKETWAKAYERAQDIDFSFRSFLQVSNAIWIKSVLYYYVQREGSAIHKPGAKLLGTTCVVQLMYDNLVNLPTDKVQYQHLLLKKLYERMIDLINLAWDGPERGETIKKCKKYEKDIRLHFWKDPHFESVQKLALCLNVRHPHAVRFIKRITKARYSWTMFAKF